MPFSDFAASAACMDYKRVGKQRVEAWQILNTILCGKKAWSNHPAVLMWRGHTDALKVYYNAFCAEWANRGYQNIKLKPIAVSQSVVMPPWVGDERLHSSHRRALLVKNPAHYAPLGWKELDSDEVKEGEYTYYWPTRSKGGK